MGNERLRSRIADRGVSLDELAQHVQVDPKTVERWITKDRVPHRTHRWATAKYLQADETYLWPDALDGARAYTASQAEFVGLHTSRAAVPGSLWRSLVDAATEAVDIVVMAGLFLPDGFPDLITELADKGRSGVRVRFALGDSDSAAVALRGREEGIGDDLAARARLSLRYLDVLRRTPGAEVRLHGTTLYNSVYRFDNEMLVNGHVYGAPAAQSPVLHLRRVTGGRLFDHYLAGFERVWATTTEAPTGDGGT
jgi:transcriptional regulator with XRE-family HTH domain